MSFVSSHDGEQMRHLFYLHGFASSPLSNKARFLSDRLEADGLTLHCPDLNQPDFSRLTVTQMINQVVQAVRELPAAPLVLFGSSLGAFVALHLAESSVQGYAPAVERMIFLSPALEFGTKRTQLGEEGLAQWKEEGWLEVTHHAFGDVRRVHYELFSDASRYDSLATVNTVPTLIVQGKHDDVVDPEMVRRFAAARPHVRLVMVDDGHQLQDSLEQVWCETSRILELESSSL